MADFDRESMLEMFSFEMNQLVDQLEQTIIESESGFSEDIINEVFRIMHTIKGSAAMMLFDTIATATHYAEDLFFYLREEKPTSVDYSELTDHVLACMDFVKEELIKIEEGVPVDGNPQPIVDVITKFLADLKDEGSGVGASMAAKEEQLILSQGSQALQVDDEDRTTPFGSYRFKAKIRFDEEAQMENVRAFTVYNNLKPFTLGIVCDPEDLTSDDAITAIRKSGFVITFTSDLEYSRIFDILNRSIYIRDIFLEEYTKESAEMDRLNSFDIMLKFDEGSQMENVRSYSVIHNLKPHADYILYHPSNLLEEASIDIIQSEGLHIDLVTARDYDEVYDLLSQTIYLKELLVKEKYADMDKDVIMQEEVRPIEVEQTVVASSPVAIADAPPAPAAEKADAPAASAEAAGTMKRTTSQAVISVSVSKLDQLLKLMGELVIVEAMVTQNPELEGLTLENFHREVRQLKKIIKDVQETVMTMRLVSLSGTFLKMNRIVRDMCKALNKEAVLEIIGENTEVDKNIIEHIGDPIMHIVRNSLDHGIEKPEVRAAAGKSERGRIVLEARNAGSEVWIIIEDDGAGLNKERIMEKARANGLLRKPEDEYTDREIFQFIFMPGFSTNEVVTSYSGRGVGMDVVNKNLEFVGGTVMVDSVPGVGSIFTMKIPLTLAIIEGMIINVSGAKYTVPIVSIRDSFRPNPEHLFMDPNGNEMITVRGDHYNVVRLHEFFALEGAARETHEGIMMIIENGEDAVCLFVDDLIGEQQVVVKSIPKYIKKIRGISGCTLLGNGEISLIVDVAGFFDR
ncbi:MAG: chemotaxis protein CheA [Clostridiales bacterium]|jgi:two-component system chemotaxis sensor kinase CheA|nr:chemotaxis protein CheA [Clostridiales bacterium]